MIVRTTPGSARVSHTAGWLLTLSPLAFVAVIVSYASTFAAAGIGLFTQITPQQMSGIAVGWVGSQVVFLLAIGMGSTGMFLLGGSLSLTSSSRWGRAVQTLAALALILSAAGAASNSALVNFTDARLGDNALYQLTLACGLGASVASAGAVIGAGLGLVVGRMRRGLGGVLAAGGLVLLAASLTNLAVPPFTIALLWMALGISVLRRPVLATASPTQVPGSKPTTHSEASLE